MGIRLNDDSFLSVFDNKFKEAIVMGRLIR
jgi:hypothetical protein